MSDRRYFVWNYDMVEVVEYERHGECNGCGQCCAAYIFYDRSGTLIGSENGCAVGDSAGPEGIWHEVTEGEHRWLIRLREVKLNASRCPSLTDDNRCAVHADKSAVKGVLPLCDIWPMGPEQVEPFDQCSYRFEEIGRWAFSELDQQETEQCVTA